MEDLFKWLLVLAIMNIAYPSCDILFQERIRLKVIREKHANECEAFPTNLTFDVVEASSNDSLMSLDLQIAEETSGMCHSKNDTHVFCLNRNGRCTSDIYVSRSSKNSYNVYGEFFINEMKWSIVTDNNEHGNSENKPTDAHFLTVNKCKNYTKENNSSLVAETANVKIVKDITNKLKEGRNKRSVGMYSVELLMVIDSAIYNWWKSLAPISGDVDTKIIENIHQYYAYIFKEIDSRFRSIEENDFEINMAFAGVVIAKTDTESFWTSTSTVEGYGESARAIVNSSEALEKFQIWLDETSDLPPYDHAILFTGSNLTYAGNPGNTGLAFAASMCRNISNSSIVEESFDSRTVTFAARQIARSLGARDDMDNNDCLEFFNFIMAPKFKLPIKSFPSNRWLFSTCSVQYFKDYIDELNEFGLNCLQSLNLAERYPLHLTESVYELPGKRYSTNEQCRRRFGVGSEICRLKIGTKYAKLCSGLLCSVPGTNACEVILPADGTPCGNMKYCLNGECAEFEDADRRLDTCVFGNEPGADCEANIAETPFRCYNTTTRYKCCFSCARRETGLRGCEYGDREKGCLIDECIIQNETYTKTDCCLTCADGPIPYPSPLADIITSMMSRPFEQTQMSVDMKYSTDSYASVVDVFSTESEKPTTSTQYKSPGSSSLGITTTYSTDPVLNERRKHFGRPEISTIPSSSVFNSYTPSVKDYVLPSSKLSTNPTTQYAFPQPSTTSEIVTALVKGSKLTPSRTVILVNEDNSIRKQTTSSPTYDVRQTLTNSSRPTANMQATDITTKKCITEKVTAIPKTAADKTDRPTTEIPTTVKTWTDTVTSNLLKPSPQIGTYAPKEKSLTIYDRIFFKELARSMRRNQQLIRLKIKQSMKMLYLSVTKTVRKFQEIESESDYTQATTVSETPSNDDDDLNRQLKPIWLRQYHELVKNLEMSIRQMRYKVLMMVNRYLRQ